MYAGYSGRHYPVTYVVGYQLVFADNHFACFGMEYGL